MKKTHSHHPDARKVAKKKVLSTLKNLAKSTDQSARNIIFESTKEIKQASAATLPNRNQLTRTINRIRNNPDFPKNPKTLQDLKFSDEICQTVDGKNFLLYDSGTIEPQKRRSGADAAARRIVMFGTKENLEFMAECAEIFMDGTFSVTPPLFNQFYTIHGK